MKRLPVYFILVLLVLSSRALSNKLPEIAAVSIEKFEAQRGDELILRIKSDARIHWQLLGEEVAQGPILRYRTKQLSSGIYEFKAQVQNESGGYYFSFYLTLKEKEFQVKNREVDVLLVSLQKRAKSSFRNDAFQIYSLQNKSILKRGKQTQLITEKPLALLPNDSFRANVSSPLYVGKKGVFQTFFQPGSKGRFLKKKQNWALQMKYGRLVLRTFEKEKPIPNFYLSESISIDLSKKTVMLLEVKPKSKQQAQLICVQGEAVVHSRLGKKLEIKKLQPGEMLTFVEGKAILSLPDSQLLERVFQQFYPDFFYSKGSFDEDDAEVEEGALEKVQASIAEGFYFESLEQIKPYFHLVETEAAWALALGAIYRKIYWSEEAFQVLSLATSGAQRDEAFYLQGALAMDEKNWPEARDYFEQVSNEYSERHLRDYYLGVIAFHDQSFYASNSHFAYSLWHKNNQVVENSSKEFLVAIKDLETFSGGAEVGLFYDTNVFRIPEEKFRPIQYKDGYAYGVSVQEYLFWNLLKTPLVLIQWQLASRKRFYLQGELTALNYLYFYTDFMIKLTMDDLLALKFDLELSSDILGGSRVADSVGGVASIELMGLPFKPAFTRKWILHSDPIPFSQNPLDPELWEVPVISDRTRGKTQTIIHLNLLERPNWNLMAKALQKSVAYRRGRALEDSYEEQMWKLEFQYKKRRWQGQSNIKVGSRAFQNSLDSRKDSSYEVEVESRFYYWPSLYFKGQLNYISQDSNRAKNKFTRSLIQTGVGWQF